MRRTLRLQRETLAELTPDELPFVVGGSGTTCYVDTVVSGVVNYLTPQVCFVTGTCTR